MNDKKIADYDSSLDMLNPNRSYMDKYPDWAQAAETNPTMRVAQAAEPRKLTGEEYLQRKVEEALSPRAAEVNPAMEIAQALEPKKITEEERQKLRESLDIKYQPDALYTNNDLSKTIKNVETIDTSNYPQNIPDKETCEILDDLLSKNQLTSRRVKYYVPPMHATEYFDEYSFDGRRFVRLEARMEQPNNITLSNGENIDKGRYYWLEVKPIELGDLIASKDGKSK